MKYCFVQNKDDEILRIKDFEDGWSPSSVDHKFGTGFAVRIIPLEIDAEPDFDPATQKVNTKRTVMVTKVRDVKTVVSLSQEEMDMIADETERDAKIVSVGQKVAVLREWANTANETTVTTENAINVLQHVVNNLGQFYNAFADLIEGQRIDK